MVLNKLNTVKKEILLKNGFEIEDEDVVSTWLKLSKFEKQELVFGDVYDPMEDSYIDRDTWNSFTPVEKAGIVIGKDVNHNWEIIDKQTSYNGYSDLECELVMINYTNNADASEYGNVRGVIIDITAGVLVCRSHTYEREAVLESIDFDELGTLTFTDLKNEQHRVNIDFDNNGDVVSLYKGLEGVTLRFFVHNGNLFVSTNRKINIIRNWEVDETEEIKVPHPFQKMFDKLYPIFPRKDDDASVLTTLFDNDKSKLFSPYYQVFMLIHPSLLFSSLEYLGDDYSNEVANYISYKDGYLVFLGTGEAWKPDDEPYYKEFISIKRFTPSNLTNQIDIVKRDPYSWIFSNEVVTLKSDNYEDALNFFNDYLLFGHSTIQNPSDERLGWGEFIIMEVQKRSSYGNIYRETYKIYSPAYFWRSNLLTYSSKPNSTMAYVINPNNNITHQFYILTTDTLSKNAGSTYFKKFTQKYPIFKNKYNTQNIVDSTQNTYISRFMETVDNKNSIKYLAKKNDRLYQVWLSLLCAVPFHKQKYVAPLLDQYYKDKEDLVEMIFYMITKVEDYEYLIHDEKHLIRISRTAQKRADDMAMSLYNPNVSKTPPTLASFVKKQQQKDNNKISQILQKSSIRRKVPIINRSKDKINKNNEEYQTELKTQIKNLIESEYGNTLYKMIKFMKSVKWEQIKT
jgi:hypothetical protein